MPKRPETLPPKLDQLSQRILEFLGSRSYRPQPAAELIRSMGIGIQEQSDFHDACRALMHAGRVVLGVGGALMLPPPQGRITGTFRANPRGFGFVIPLEPSAHADLYIPRGATGGAMTGDTVLAVVKKRGKRAGKMMYEGVVLEIISRGQSRVVGELLKGKGRWFVIPDGQVLHAPVFIGDPGAKNARPGDHVVVEITQYPTERQPARGVIAKVLGRRGAPGVDTLAIIEQYELPREFPPEVLDEAARLAQGFKIEDHLPQREDLRDLTAITIDPPDARDFDDAISITSLGGGRFELGVHIADVSSFVPENGALDQHARTRSTSVYFPGHVLPMLPEALSNDVCSLQEGQPRLTKSVFVTYDRAGNVLATRFANTVISSAKRLTYPQAQDAIEGKGPRLSAKVVSLLGDADRLARAIFDRRMKQGMLRLDLPEVEVVLDDDGAPIDVRRADTSFSHTIIEMFMVEANEAVARALSQTGVPFLRRVHDVPTAAADATLRNFLKALGHPLSARPDRFELQRLLEETRGKPEGFAVHLAILRSLSQAEYSPAPLGHFALASEDYCHFTSPIRRYPDLTVHRLFNDLLVPNAALPPRFQTLASEGSSRSNRRPRPRNSNAKLRNASSVSAENEQSPLEAVSALGKHCSICERRAEAAERELKLVMTLRILEARLGDTIEGTVTGISNVGLFVQLDHYLVDGLLAFDALADDWWEIDESRGVLVGQRTGRKIKVGDRMPVVIARISIPLRRLDLTTRLDATLSAQKARPATKGKHRPQPRIKRREQAASKHRSQPRSKRRRSRG